MRRIEEFIIKPLAKVQDVEMPGGAAVLGVFARPNDVVVLANVDWAVPKVKRRFWIVRGHDAVDEKWHYIGSYDFPAVVHVFTDRLEYPPDAELPKEG